MSRLGKLFRSDRCAKRRRWAHRNRHQGCNHLSGQTIVLKGRGYTQVVTVTAIAFTSIPPETSSLSQGRAPAMSLSGIVGTLLAEKLEPFHAACIAVWLHGRAGEIAGRRVGMRCVLAREVIDALPQAIREFEAKT